MAAALPVRPATQCGNCNKIITASRVCQCWKCNACLCSADCRQAHAAKEEAAAWDLYGNNTEHEKETRQQIKQCLRSTMDSIMMCMNTMNDPSAPLGDALEAVSNSIAPLRGLMPHLTHIHRPAETDRLSFR
jgi:hypothetical protein